MCRNRTPQRDRAQIHGGPVQFGKISMRQLPVRRALSRYAPDPAVRVPLPIPRLVAAVAEVAFTHGFAVVSAHRGTPPIWWNSCAHPGAAGSTGNS